MNWSYFRRVWLLNHKTVIMQTNRKKTSKLIKWVAFCFRYQRLKPLFIKSERSYYKIEKPEQDPQCLLSHFHGQSPHILCQSQAQICPSVLCQEYRGREQYKQTALFPMQINQGHLFPPKWSHSVTTVNVNGWTSVSDCPCRGALCALCFLWPGRMWARQVSVLLFTAMCKVIESQNRT